MRLRILFCIVLVLSISACGDSGSTYDTSSPETIKSSIMKMATELTSDAEKQQFLTDLLTVSLSLQQAKGDWDGKAVEHATNELLHGKTVSGIHRLASKLDVMTEVERRQWMKRHLNL